MCPFSRGAFHESEFLPPEAAGKKWAKATGKGSALAGSSSEIDPPPRGALADKAASILMQVLYAARYARFDLLCAVARLAQKISKWTVECDLALLRLMSYIHSTLGHRLVGYVGDAPVDVGVHVYADADFAGDPSTKRSTTGVHVCLRGTYTYFPINGQSKRQECVSHSTPEAEIVAADWALMREGIPTLDLWDVVIKKGQKVIFHDDNESMIKVCKSGKNPTMRHMLRSHGVSVAWLKEQFDSGNYDLRYVPYGLSGGRYLYKELRQRRQMERQLQVDWVAPQSRRLTFQS